MIDAFNQTDCTHGIIPTMKAKAKTPRLLLGSNGKFVIAQIARVLRRPARSIKLAYVRPPRKA